MGPPKRLRKHLRPRTGRLVGSCTSNPIRGSGQSFAAYGAVLGSCDSRCRRPRGRYGETMNVFFIGGSLDGQIGDAPRDEGQDYMDYHLANGIARHESVSEEEVARRVAEWREAARRFLCYRAFDKDGNEVKIA